MIERSDPTDLAAIIDAALDGVIEQDECRALLELLRADASARAVYRERSQIHAMLNWIRRPMAAIHPDEPEDAALLEAIPMSEDRVTSRPGHRGRWFAVAASIAVIVAVGLFARPNPERPGPAGSTGPAVGVLLDAEGLQWGSPPINIGDEIYREPFTILSGTLGMQLHSGVELQTRGATTASVQNPMAVRLHSGTLRVKVPEGAEGFTVHSTHGVRIVDLGTEFEVTDDGAGRLVVRVISGRVRIEAAVGVNRIVTAGHVAETIDGKIVTVKSAPGEDALVHRWTFNADARDDIGHADAQLLGGAHIEAGRLALDGLDDLVRTEAVVGPLAAKTLVAWVSPANLDQGGGGVLGIEQGEHDEFDAIGYGERTPRVWMAASNSFLRSQEPPQSGDPETAAPGEFVMVAITYEIDGGITVYRNGQAIASYTTSGPVAFEGARVLIGRRHTQAGPAEVPYGPHFAGSIDEARIYNRALSADEIEMIHAQGPVTAESEPSPPQESDAPAPAAGAGP